MKRRIFSIITALALCLSLLPGTVCAVEGGEETYKTRRTNQITLSPSTASVDNLSSEGWKWDKDTYTLTLNGLDLDVSGGGIWWSSPSAQNTVTIQVEGENRLKSLTGSCSVTVTASTVHVTGVTLNKTSLALAVGSSEQLTVRVAPSNAADQSVSWTSGNPAVATVDARGNVTAVSAGTATITVTTTDGGKTASCDVTVEAQGVIIPPAEDDEIKFQFVTETGISAVPEGLKDNEALNTPEKLVTAMKTAIMAVNTGISQENTAVYDVTLMVSVNGGAWTPATKENFPSGGLTVTLPYPDGTDSRYQFTVVHMFTTAGFGHEPGDTETPAVTNMADGIQFTVTALSPISVGWVPPAASAIPAGSSGGGGGGSAAVYPITVEKPEHGKVTSNRTGAVNNSMVTLTVTPDSGYVLDTLTVTDSRGNEIKLTAQSGGKYTFTMPSRAVTVKATFAPLPKDVDQPCDGGAACPSRSFADLGTIGTWYHEAIDYVLRNGLMGGYGNGTFGPNNNLTRAQFAQILYNKEGKPTVTGSSIFADVADGLWCAPAVTSAAANGIVGGYSNGLFRPNDNITREQLAVILWRNAGSPAATDRELHFTDADKASGYTLDALRWAAENGILNGYGDGRLNPQGLATRAQVAQMLQNYLEK